MRSVAVFSKGNTIPQADIIEMEGTEVAFGLVCQDNPEFDASAPENAEKVLAGVKAFSCNFRDKALIFMTARKGAANAYYVLGSDFVGEVVAVGSAVSKLAVGDKVIENGHWSGASGAVPEGLPTNHGSKELQAFHQDKLLKIPSEMSLEVAAAFGIGAQTAYSMVRKIELTLGENVLVTAAKSNTSLFAINALKKYSVNVYATSTSRAFEAELKTLGVKELLQGSPAENDFASVYELAAKIGKFDAVIDPFFDLHLAGVLPAIANGGRYTTCGLHNQYASLIDKGPEVKGANLTPVMSQAMINNIHLIGNCLGVTEDLEQALRDYAAGDFDVVIDSVFSGDEIGAFFERTYNAKDRFGKVVYRYA